MSQIHQGTPPGTPPLPAPQNPKRRPSFFTRALGGSAAVHGLFALWMLFSFLFVKPKPVETLLEVDLTKEAKPTPQPTKEAAKPKPVETKAPQPKPTPQRVAKAPTPEPTKAQPKAQPTAQPTSEKPKPKPTEAVAKTPPKAAPTPEANEGKKTPTQPSPGPKNNNTRLRQDRPTEKFAGLRNVPRPGDGAPKGPGKPRFDEEAGALPGDKTPGAGKNDPNTRRRVTDDPFNQPSAGQNDNQQTPLPQGLPNGRRFANRNDLAPGKLDNNLRGLGRPGGGSPGNWSQSPDSGSRNGNNDELAGSDGGGGANLPRRMARRGGGGGPDAYFPTLNNSEANAVPVDAGKPGLTPGRGGGQGGGRGGGAGRNSGGGIGTMFAGVDRGALNTRPGSGVGAGSGNGVGGPRGSGDGGEVAGGGGGSGGGFGRGQGSGYGDGQGGFGGGNGKRKGRFAGDPFGTPNGAPNGDPNGGGGNGNGPGGPGRGQRFAMRGGDGPGDGTGDGAGRGPGGRGNGFGDGPGRGAGGFGRGPGAGGGKGSGDGTGPGIGGGNGGGNGGNGPGGRGGDGDAGNGDGEAGNGGGGRGRPFRNRPGAQREIEGENSIGRGIWGGFKIQYFQDTADHPDLPDATFNPGHPIDWQPFTKLVATKTSPNLNFDWGTDPPAPGMRHTFWSFKASGKIFVPKDDTYEFFFDELDDAGRLFLNDRKIIEVWMVQKSTPSSGKFFLKRGAHDLRIEYVQGPATAASIKLSWKSTSFGKEIIGVYKPNE